MKRVKKNVYSEYKELEFSPEELEEFDFMRKNFKPEFGNPDHIQILEVSKKLAYKERKQLERFEKYKVKRIKLNKPRLGVETLYLSGVFIRKLKRQFFWLLKTYGKFNPKRNSEEED